MPARLTGQLYIYRTHGLYVGPLIATARHQHHSGQITWAPDGLEVEVEGGDAQRVVTQLVPPHVAHRHDPAVRAAVVWLDRDDLRWDRAQQASFDPPAGLRIDEPLAPDTARELAAVLLALVAPVGAAKARVALHPAVKRMCALLDANTATPQLSLAALARRAGLSPRQLRHQFTQEIGINPSAYLRWRRLRRAAAAIERGATLTEAAIEGGFADGAHFSRVFHAQFGMTPSQAFSSVHFASPADGSTCDGEG